MVESLVVYRERPAGSAALDTATSRALLGEVAAGRRGASLRLYPAPDALAFSIVDRNQPGFRRACAAAEDHDFEPILRLAGGRAAIFTEACVAFAWVTPARASQTGIAERFDRLAGWVQAALSSLGVDARVGEIPGEYCPGAHSVNARSRVKLMGVGQRIVKGAAHVGGVISVSRAAEMARVLSAVYAELGYPFRPETVGAVADEVSGADVESVCQALLAQFATHYTLEQGELDPVLRAGAEEREADHRATFSGHTGVAPGAATRKTVSEASKA